MTKHPAVAYFCMEFAVRGDMQLYAGGLGVLAGDVLKAAGDEGRPLVGVGIFWSEGYVSQRLEDGRIEHEWRLVPRDALEALDVAVSVTIRGAEVPLRAFRLSGAHAPLYLLEPRDVRDRWITRRLYQGAPGDRIAQEIVLGVGGVRLLRALGTPVDVVHLNEGHAVFAALEMARERMQQGLSFEDAVQRGRSQVVFTTHTPVAAGNEEHGLDALVEQGAGLGVVSRAELAALGGDPFSMTVAALRSACRSNAVAQLHARTAQGMWSHVAGAAPIVGITNGVHVPTWQDPALAAAALDGDPWPRHLELKAALVERVREATGVRLGADGLLVGFARRVTHYKRPDLIFRNLDRIAPWLESGRLQLVFSGKAYPDDAGSRAAVDGLVAMTRRFPDRVAFLPDYGLDSAGALVRGCDAWLNNPIRPMEASGTSGMKAALNGVLNVSVLDGWWAEACEHGVNGWQFGDGREGEDAERGDLEALLTLLERDVLPTWEADRPRWIRMMIAAEATARTGFSSRRMLDEYEDLLWRSVDSA